MSNTKHATSAWSVLSNPMFRTFWIAGLLSGIGAVVQDVTAGWLMMQLAPSPLFTALLQTAGSIPVVLLALPAGALADVLDRRRFMLLLQTLMMLLAATLGVLALRDGLSPVILLGMIAAMSMASALNTPAWMRTVPDVLDGPEIPLGVTLNSTAVNMARTVGGVVAGVLLAQQFRGAGFFANALSFVPLIVVLLLWRGPHRDSQLPPERFPGALAAGWRYVRNSPGVRNVQIRCVLFALGASAVPALLPLVGQRVLKLDAVSFGFFMATFGAGAVVGASALGWLSSRLPSNTLINIATLTMAASLLALGQLREFALLLPVLLIAGAGWVVAVSTFGVATGSNSPRWVLSRSLSFFMLTFQGGVALGSVVWGSVASSLDLATTLSIAGVATTLTLLSSLAFPLFDGEPQRMVPSQFLPAPPQVDLEEQDRGPVLVSVEYRVAPEQSYEFRVRMRAVREERLRDGAFQWFLFIDSSDPELHCEHFLVPSWLEHLRQHERITEVDTEVLRMTRAFHRGPEPPLVRHLIAPK